MQLSKLAHRLQDGIKECSETRVLIDGWIQSVYKAVDFRLLASVVSSGSADEQEDETVDLGRALDKMSTFERFYV